jgi:hypothetical protein
MSLTIPSSILTAQKRSRRHKKFFQLTMSTIPEYGDETRNPFAFRFDGGKIQFIEKNGWASKRYVSLPQDGTGYTRLTIQLVADENPNCSSPPIKLYFKDLVLADLTWPLLQSWEYQHESYLGPVTFHYHVRDMRGVLYHEPSIYDSDSE